MSVVRHRRWHHVKASSFGTWTGPALFSTGNFTNASARYLLDPITPQIVDSVAGGTLATVSIGGKTYGQFESAFENVLTRTQELDHTDWTPTQILSRTAVADPVGGSTAYKVVPTVDAGNHYIRQTKTPDGSSQYTYYVIAREAGYDWIWLQVTTQGYVGNCDCYFDVNNGTKGTAGGGCDASSITDIGGGWYLCTITITSDAAAASEVRLWIAEADGDFQFSGDGSSGVTFWNPQMGKSAWPTSPVKCVAAAVTRAKDQFNFAHGVVPAAVLGGDWQTKFVNFWSQAEMTGNAYILALGANDYIRFNGTSKKVEVYAGGAKKVESAALTMARYNNPLVKCESASGKLTITGADAGDSTETGTAWTFPSATQLDIGSDSSQANQFCGLIMELEAP
jgi:hypothetical protein